MIPVSWRLLKGLLHLDVQKIHLLRRAESTVSQYAASANLARTAPSCSSFND